MQELEITNPDGITVTITVDMDRLWSLAQCFVEGTTIAIPPNYFNKNGATIEIH